MPMTKSLDINELMKQSGFKHELVCINCFNCRYGYTT